MQEHQTVAIAQIIEMDQERDRKTCIMLDQKVAGANRELAQWLLDHPKYEGTEVARWLGCNKRRIQRLRAWAKDGFQGSPTDKSNVARQATSTSPPSFKTNENSESDDDSDGIMPTEEEANESWQADVYDHACLLVERMAGSTRQKFFAHLRKTYP